MNARMRSRVFAEARTDNFVFAPVRERSRAKSFVLVPAGRAGISMGMKITAPARTIVTNEAALLGWFEAALPGECFNYHIGHLASDRARETSRLPATAREMLGRIADHVMALVGQRLLIAVQRRLDDGRVAYLAIKAGMRSTARRAR